MQEDSNNNNIANNFDDNIDIKELLSIFLKRKLTIIGITLFVSFVGLLYSLFLPNIYESKAVLTPNDSSSSISRSLQSYAGLAGLAGISLPSVTEEGGNSAQAIQKLNSLSFFEKNILPNIFLPDLMALKSWDHRKNKLSYDDKSFNISSNTWVRKYSYPQKQIPSAQESFEEFKNILSLNEDSKTGFITVKIKHKSPLLAKEWTELVIDQINSFYRLKDKSESERAVEYLNNQIAMTSLSEVKEAISQLLKEETKKLTLIEANQFYVFEYIDPPAAMEKKSEPKRALICFMSFILGLILAILTALLQHYRENHNKL